MDTNKEAVSALHDLNGFRTNILYSIRALDHPNGQDLKTKLRGQHGPITHSRVYQNLRDLEDRGLIERDDWMGDDRSKTIHLTPKGRKTVAADWEWRESAQHDNHPRTEAATDD